MLKRENESTENILNQELVIPEETQRKIEAAYDIVRARSRAAQGGQEKTEKAERAERLKARGQEASGSRRVLKPSAAKSPLIWKTTSPPTTSCLPTHRSCHSAPTFRIWPTSA